MNIELYFAPGACSFVAHFALEAAKAATGQTFEPKLLKLHKGEQKSPEYLALNPNGQVPLLVVDGTPLSQIVAIGDFLDRAFPQAKLLPTEPMARAQAMSTFAWLNNSVHPTFTHFYMPSKFAADEGTQAAIKSHAQVEYRRHIERIQSLVSSSGSPYLNGTTPGLLDAYVLTLFRWSGIADIDPASVPALRDFVHRVAQTPTMATVIARERINLDTYKPA